jgi:hypothetical protein
MRPDDQLEQPGEEPQVDESTSEMPGAVAPKVVKGKAVAATKNAPKRKVAALVTAKAPAKTAKAPAKTAKARATATDGAPKAAAATKTVADEIELVEEKKPAAKAKAGRTKGTPRPLPRLLARFREEIQPALFREFSYKSPMQVPQVKKSGAEHGAW